MIELTPELIANRIIKQARGQRLTDAGARQAIEEAVRDYGTYQYKLGLLAARKALIDLNKRDSIIVLTNIMEMV